MKSKSNQTIAYDFKSRDIKVLKKLLPYLIKMRARVIWAVSFLMLAKLANVAVPLALKEIVDSLDQTNLVLILPLGMLLAYGLLRLASSLFNELRGDGFKNKRGVCQALENVLIPETLPTHRERLSKAGFSDCSTWFQCFNFASMIAIA